MERAVRTVVRPSGRPAVDGNDPAYEWQGARLRPTGVVVFATLDHAGVGSGRRDAPAGAPRRSGSLGGHDWRRHALRPMAWLLGR